MNSFADTDLTLYVSSTQCQFLSCCSDSYFFRCREPQMLKLVVAFAHKLCKQLGVKPVMSMTQSNVYV